jgi:WhiB family transcriptional regulator, redox-sensing transcriptional regulator
MSWRERAACRGMNTNLWFPHDPDEEDTPDQPRRRETPRLYRHALRVCNACPVRQECLDYALEAREGFGMWGGKTRPERQTILRERRQAAREAAT